MLAILGPTRTQVNAKGLLRELHAAEEGLHRRSCLNKTGTAVASQATPV